MDNPIQLPKKTKCKQTHFLPLITLILFLDFGLVSCKKWAEDDAIVTQSDYQALKSIKHELVDLRGVLDTWNDTGPGPCSNWAGIKCVRGHVISIQLPWKGLGGRLSENIGQLHSLRRLSLHDNVLVGPVPTSLGSLQNLRGVYLFNNRLSGTVPPSIGNCLNLQTLDLSNNQLIGIIPLSLGKLSRVYRLNLSNNLIVGNIPDELGNLSKLSFLDLSNNAFYGKFPNNFANLSVLNLSNNKIRGQIPETIGNITSLVSLDLSENNLTGEIPTSIVNLQNLTFFDVSYNNLSGSVPSVLAEKFNSSSFLGNVGLCGYSNSTPCPSQNHLPSPSPSRETVKNKRKLSTRDVIIISAGALLAVLLILCCVLLCCLFRRKKSVSNANKDKSGNSKAIPSLARAGDESGGEMGGKLVHFDGPFVFTADDLLCATAEIMGKGSYGTAYKATLEDTSTTTSDYNNDNSNQVAVKRLREKITKGRKEFEIEIAQLGMIRHPNILPLRAYYVGPKGEKLLVYDYMPNGSLASFLHARGPETIVQWSTRLSIAIGTTRGLCYLHDVENIVHGNLTSSNVLLDEQTSPKIADVGLTRLMTGLANTDAVATAGTMGYRAPELTKVKNASAKSDVFSLGVIILELLTGKSPSEATDGLDLPQWVASIVKEEWTNEVFDVELMRAGVSDIGDELLNVLKLALHCVDPSPGARPEAKQVLEKLEEIKPGPTDVLATQASVDDIPAKKE